MRDRLPSSSRKAASSGQVVASVRASARGSKRVKLRARENARLQCQNLELDIMNLRQEIATLKTTRELLYARTFNRPDDVAYGSFAKIIREFYALTHAGYGKIVWRNDESDPVAMEQYMRACFDDALTVSPHGPLTPGGLDTFLTRMEQVVYMLDSPRIRLAAIHVRANEADDTAIVTVKTRGLAFPTTTLLDALFPHLAEQFPWLRARLVSREMVLNGEGDYVFDRRHGRVVRALMRLDLSASILALAESEEELAILKGEELADFTAREVVNEFEDRGVDTISMDTTSQDYLPTSERTQTPFEAYSNVESSRSSASLSPMSLEHVLSPERAHEEDTTAGEYLRQDPVHVAPESYWRAPWRSRPR